MRLVRGPADPGRRRLKRCENRRRSPAEVEERISGDASAEALQPRLPGRGLLDEVAGELARDAVGHDCATKPLVPKASGKLVERPRVSGSVTYEETV